MTAATSLLVCWAAKYCMCYLGHIFFLFPICMYFFDRPTVKKHTIECSDTCVFQPVDGKPSALPSQEVCPVGQPTFQFCEMWCNYDSAEKQGQERDGIYYSLQIISFELTANGFCFFFSRLISRFNSFCSPLALSIFLSFLNYVYTFTCPKVTNILVLGSFSIKRRSFDPLCKTWLTCFTSPLCNLSAEQQINIQVITASLLKSWSNQFKLKYNFWYYTVLLPTLIYQNIYIYMSDAERWSQKSGLLICIIIFEHFLIRDAFCISIDDFQLLWYVCSVFVINKLLEYFCTWLCDYVFTCTKKSIITEVPENVLCLSVLSDFIFQEDTWKLWVSEGMFHYSFLFWSPLAYWDGRTLSEYIFMIPG